MVAYTNEENINICKAYINASKDPIAGVDQTATVFKSKVFENYQTLMKAANGRNARNVHDQAKTLIKHSKRYECHYKAVHSIDHSGRSDDDLQRYVIKRCMTDPDSFGKDKCFKAHSRTKNRGIFTSDEIMDVVLAKDKSYSMQDLKGMSEKDWNKLFVQTCEDKLKDEWPVIFIYEDCANELRSFLSNVEGSSKVKRSPGRKMAKAMKKARVQDLKGDRDMEASFEKCMEATAKSAIALSQGMVTNFSRTVLLNEHSKNNILSTNEYTSLISQLKKESMQKDLLVADDTIANNKLMRELIMGTELNEDGSDKEEQDEDEEKGSDEE